LYSKTSNSWLKHWDFILLDLLVLQLAYFISCIARNGGSNPYQDQLYLGVAMILCFVDISTSFFMESYRGIMRRGYFQEFKAVCNHVLITTFLLMSYLYLSKNADNFSRISFVSFVISSVVLIYIARILWKHYLLSRKGVFYNKRAILVVTTSNRAQQTLTTVLKNTYNELEVIGVVLADTDEMVGEEIEGIKVVCRTKDMLDYIQTRWVDGVLINTKKRDLLPEDLLPACIEMGITVHTELAVVGEDTKHQQLDRIGGYVVLSTTVRVASARQMFVKRAMDIVGAIVGLIATGIITLFLGPALYLASPGPIFFSQIRVGKNGRKFKIYKFRSMYMDAEERKKELLEKNEMQGFMFKMDADPRIIGSGPDGTKHGLGWFIRKTSIDEFPQFWNILKGEMSLVGTRPPTVDEWEQYARHHRGRLATKPGLTGMWQVSGRSDITDFEEVVRLDMEYIQKWNIGLDIKILLKTILVVFEGRGSK
jgi:exopolysaccharide biosynthesis polyprenyl glycosylphosphotransferase